MSPKWISAAEAFKLVATIAGISQTARIICSRAAAGLIRAKAATFFMDEQRRDNFDIPKEFWWARGEAALEQDWPAGDFETWLEKAIHLRAFGVSFSRSDIEALISPAALARATPTPPSPAPGATPASVVAPGGRPPAAWWDDLWVEMCRQLYLGDLKPEKQSDLQTAMMKWVSARGHSAADSTIRDRARKLWVALNRDDEN